MVRVRAHRARGRNGSAQRTAHAAVARAPRRVVRAERLGARLLLDAQGQLKNGWAGTAATSRLINTLGRGLLYPTGSRPAKRQGGGRSSAGIETIARAARDPEQRDAAPARLSREQLRGSRARDEPITRDSSSRCSKAPSGSSGCSRSRSRRGERSDVTMFEAYVQLMNANYWLDRTSQSLDRGWNRVLRRISEVLGEVFDYDSIGASCAGCAAMRPISTTCSSSTRSRARGPRATRSRGCIRCGSR